MINPEKLSTINGDQAYGIGVVSVACSSFITFTSESLDVNLSLVDIFCL